MGVVDKDGQLTAKLPKDVPPGAVDLIVQLEGDTVVVEVKTSAVSANSARETARAKLAAAGRLSSARWLPPGTQIPTDGEVRAAGVLPPDARPSADLIDEDRNEL
jgi:hypothetical protein